MVQTCRHRRIEEMLEERGACSVEDLAIALCVSDMTVRRDLQRLAETGRVVRTHGGAMPAANVTFEFQFLRRSKLNEREKELIGEEAAKLVQDGQSLLLDSGTTTLALARHLRSRRGLTVITTSLPIAAALQHAPDIQTVLLGGFVRRDTPDLGGPMTENNLESLRADIAFVGADAIDSQGNVYNGSIETGRMLTKMTSRAAQTYVLADGSKLGRTALMQFGNLKSWQALITDASAPAVELQLLSQAAANVTIAGTIPAAGAVVRERESSRAHA